MRVRTSYKPRERKKKKKKNNHRARKREERERARRKGIVGINVQRREGKDEEKKTNQKLLLKVCDCRV